MHSIRLAALAVIAISLCAGEVAFAEDQKAEPKPAERAPGPEVDAAIARLKELGAFVREFHPRNHPQHWVQIISTGIGATTRRTAENFDDEALRDVEIIVRGASADLHLRETTITGDGLAHLKSARTISHLELSGNNVNDETLKALPLLPLEGRLHIESNQLTDEDLQPVAACKKVVSVGISGRLLTNACLEHVVGLPKLTGVSLGANFTPDAFSILARAKRITDIDVSWQAAPELGDYRKFPNLRKLSLSGKGQDDDSARTIADSFQSLEQAYLRETSITNAGLEQLSRLEKLKTLTLDGAAVDDDAGDSIRRMKQLEWLSLEGCAVGDAMLAAIAECPKLRYLSLSRTRLTDEGLAELSKLKDLHMLYLSHCKSVTDEGVAALKKLAAPEQRGLHLNIQATSIGEEAARELQAALPHANIIWGVPPVKLR